MNLGDVAFWGYAGTVIGAALLVVLSRNPVHSVLWLILAFISSAGLFVLLGAEFVAMLLVIVYVGAVAVLFLFVVMMLDVDFAALRSGFQEYLPIGALVGLVLLIELVLVIAAWTFGDAAITHRAAVAPRPEDVSNTVALGRLIYTEYFLLFQLAGLVLLVSMVGAIVLTLRKRAGVRRQNVMMQIHRTREQSVELRDVKPGRGI